VKPVLGKLLAGIAGVVALVPVYGVLVEPRLLLDTRSYEVSIPNLDERWQGERIAVASDLQVGMWFANLNMVRRVAGTVVENEPAALLLAGDFVYSRDPPVEAQVDLVLELLQPVVDADIPVYAVLGNHDYAVGGAPELRRAFDNHGITLLSNEAATIPLPDARAEPLRLVGIGPLLPGLSRPAEAFEDVPDDAPRVVVMHNPRSFPDIPAHHAPLSVAGHTHCGQIGVPGMPHWSYLQLRYDHQVVVDGFAPPDYGAEGNGLFVTCGVGFSMAPIRISAPPQVVFFELRRPGG
jgi:uncharacterized protein